MIAFLTANKAAIFAGLFGVSELLAMIPQVKANGIFQWVFSLLKKEADSNPPAQS